MSAFNYSELIRHVNHKIVCVTYGLNDENDCLRPHTGWTWRN